MHDANPGVKLAPAANRAAPGRHAGGRHWRGCTASDAGSFRAPSIVPQAAAPGPIGRINWTFLVRSAGLAKQGGQMAGVSITIACGNYDRTRPIMDGRVRVEGCDVTCLPLYPEEIFFRAFRYHEFDVCELSFSSYLRTVAAGTSAYTAIPAFVSRIFRHSGIYIRRDAGIAAPADLRGKRVGLPEYQITAVVWMRGMLEHEYGVAPAEIHWRSGGQEEPGRRERTPLKPIAGVDLKSIGDEETLVGMLRKGELDALFTARAPSSFVRGEPHIARLFPDTRTAELAYFKKTGLFPIMHLIGIRTTLLARYPWLATSVYKAFCEAKALAMADLRDVNALAVTLPFLEAETLATMAAMGEDFWRYGVNENRGEIGALTGYAFEQGLVDRKLGAEELFAPSVFELSKV
jgi:4,5-dihydroxyphthalate decarboxylase